MLTVCNVALAATKKIKTLEAHTLLNPKDIDARHKLVKLRQSLSKILLKLNLRQRVKT